MKTTNSRQLGPRFKSRTEQVQYWTIFSLCFAAFLAAALFQHLIPRQWRRTGDEPGQSTLRQAWSAADTATSYAFMG